ncbi:MAG: COX15/CtaA family protein [Methylovirgula sp.]
MTHKQMRDMTETTLCADAPKTAAGLATHRTALRIWLWSVAGLVFAMVVVGGATRLTESGLSITEWQPIVGVLPPLSHAAWVSEFDKYKGIPQYSAIFSNLDLNGFKFIFFWEWSHRLLGRLIGLAFALPLIVFWARGALNGALKVKLLGVLALGGLQGVVGWWMVESGLVGRIEVAQQRLAIHLLLACLTLAALVWIAGSLASRAEERSARWQRILALAILLVTFTQIFLGALVAGLRAGQVYNTWPLMDGHFAPPLQVLTALSPFWRNLTDNVAMVQFQHRMVAYTLLALAIAQAIVSVRLARGSRGARRAIGFVHVVTLQVVLGIATLLLAVPLWAGLLHQAFAMVVLGFATRHAQALSGGSAAATYPLRRTAKSTVV